MGAAVHLCVQRGTIPNCGQKQGIVGQARRLRVLTSHLPHVVDIINHGTRKTPVRCSPMGLRSPVSTSWHAGYRHFLGLSTFPDRRAAAFPGRFTCAAIDCTDSRRRFTPISKRFTATYHFRRRLSWLPKASGMMILGRRRKALRREVATSGWHGDIVGIRSTLGKHHRSFENGVICNGFRPGTVGTMPFLNARGMAVSATLRAVSANGSTREHLRGHATIARRFSSCRCAAA